MPLTLISGIGGMSEFTMMTGQDHWRLAYPVLMLGMCVIGVITFFFITRLEKRGKRD
jgi:magnesium transporter